jgi:hypothetical protein
VRRTGVALALVPSTDASGQCQSQHFRARLQESLWQESHRQSAGIQHRVSLRHDRRSVPDEGTYGLPRSDPLSNRT